LIENPDNGHCDGAQARYLRVDGDAADSAKAGD